MVSTSTARVPATPQVIRVTDKLFKAGAPFVVRTHLTGTPLGQGDVADVVEKLAAVVTFSRTARVDEEGEQLTAYLGELDDTRALDALVAERSPSLGTLIQALDNPQMRDAMLDFQVKTLARAFAAERHVRVLVDDQGWLRGWDVGPAPGTWALTVRLSNIATKVAPGAFDLAPEMEKLAVDQTPALVAQTESLEASFDDKKAVEDVRTRIREALAAPAPQTP